VTPTRRVCVCLVVDRVPPVDRIGGVERYTYDLARGLHELGHEVHVVARGSVPIRRDGLGFTIHGIAPTDLDDRIGFSSHPVCSTNARFAVAAARRIAALQREGIAFDVVHASNWNACGLGVLCARLAPLVLMLVTPLSEIMGGHGWEPTDDLRHAVALDRWQVENADAVCCPSWGVLDVYEETMGLSLRGRPTMYRTPLGVAPTPASPVAGRGRKRLLFVGRLEQRKGIHVLLAVLPRLLAAHPDWECDLVGDDSVVAPGTDATFRATFEAGPVGSWRDRVHFRGPVADQELARFFASCDVFVAPSLFESFGLIYPEAMQYGKPVVGCRTGGIPEVVRDGVDGLLVPPDDAEALAGALDRLMSDAALRERLGDAARTSVRERFDHRAMAAGLVAVYERVAAGGRAGRRARLGRSSDPAVDRILETIAAHVAGVPAADGSTAVPLRTHRIRELLEGARTEPIGGRLAWLKKLVCWFTASAFDRQAKAQEALLAALVEVEQEMARLRIDEGEVEGSRRPTSGSFDASEIVTMKRR